MTGINYKKGLNVKKILFGLAICFLSTVVFGADKVGYVNMQKVFEGYYRTVQENAQFEVRKQTFDAKSKILKEEYVNTMEDTKKAQAEAMNELLAEKVRKAASEKFDLLRRRLQEKDTELRRFSQENIRELQDSRNQTEETLITELIEQVKRYASGHQYTHIYEVSGKTLNRVPTLIVYPEEQEITNEIMKLVNSGHEKDLAAAQENVKELREKSEKMQTNN